MGSSRSWTDNKWMATAASIWIQCTSGSLYTFSIYSAALKSTQLYDQSTLDTVSVFKDIGGSAGLLSGLLYTAATSPPSSSSRTAVCRRGGPWVVLAAGAIQCFAGYFLMWLSVAGLVPRPPVALMCFYMLMAAHATSFFNKRIGRCCQAEVLSIGAERLIRLFIARINDLDIDQAMYDSDLYALRFNPNVRAEINGQP